MKMDSTKTNVSNLPSTSGIKTRRESSNYIFGLPAVLPKNELPTIYQIVRYFVQLKKSQMHRMHLLIKSQMIYWNYETGDPFLLFILKQLIICSLS